MILNWEFIKCNDLLKAISKFIGKRKTKKLHKKLWKEAIQTSFSNITYIVRGLEFKYNSLLTVDDEPLEKLKEFIMENMMGNEL